MKNSTKSTLGTDLLCYVCIIGLVVLTLPIWLPLFVVYVWLTDGFFPDWETPERTIDALLGLHSD